MSYTQDMVAVDTFDRLADRVERLLSHGRPMAMSRRYTWTQEPPELYAGQTVRRTHRWSSGDQGGLSVVLEPGIACFEFAYHGPATSKHEWARFHAAKADSPIFGERRRNMTCVAIYGDGEYPLWDDRIVIQEWNDDGVCDERVIVFDNTKKGSNR